MSNTEDFQNKKSEIDAIPKEKMQKPNIPMDVYLQESELLYKRAQKDAPKLNPVGISNEMIEELPVRTGACRETQSIWIDAYRSRQDSMQIWLDRSPEGYKLRDELVDTFIFAFHGDEQLVNKVRTIAEGATHADMIQDLNDLSILGKNNSEKLTAISYDVEKLDTAATLSDQLAGLWADADGDKDELNEHRVRRDKAYTYLKQLVDEIRRCGNYVFREDERHQNFYKSHYRQNKRKKTEPDKKTANYFDEIE